MSTTEDHTEPGTEERESRKLLRYNVDRWDPIGDPTADGPLAHAWISIATYLEVPGYRLDTEDARYEAIRLAVADYPSEMQYGRFKVTRLHEGRSNEHTRTQVLKDDWS